MFPTGRFLNHNQYSFLLDSERTNDNNKLRPYINTMRKNIAAAMKTDTSAVSVKATTEERLGFTGHLEGVAAHSVALIYKV